jgi:hypothetical protein
MSAGGTGVSAPGFAAGAKKVKPQMDTDKRGFRKKLRGEQPETIGRKFFHQCLSVFICGSILSAQVRVTCIVEPNERLKDVEQLGCDFRNLQAQPVVLSAGDVRDGSFEKIGSPLRYSVAAQMIERSEKRGSWGTFFLVVKWASVAATALQGFDVIQIGGKLQAVLPGIATGLQTVDSLTRQGYKPLTMPPDYLPEGDFVLDANETRSYVLLAGKTGLASFRMSLQGRTLSVGREPFDRDVMTREALARINGWVYEVADDRVFEVPGFSGIPTTKKETEGGSRFAVRQVGIRQGEPVKGVEVLTVAGAAALSIEFGAPPLPLSLICEFPYAGLDAAAFGEWVLAGAANASMAEWSAAQK